MTRPREDWELHAGCVSQTRGAWLIVVHDPEGNAVPDDEFTCASSLAVAKRTAVAMARGFGYSGAHRWEGNYDDRYDLHFTRYHGDDR